MAKLSELLIKSTCASERYKDDEELGLFGDNYAELEYDEDEYDEDEDW